MTEEEPNFLMFLAHGERPMLTELELARLNDDLPIDLSPLEIKKLRAIRNRGKKMGKRTQESPKYDENKYFVIPESDDNIYVTFSRINQSLYTASIKLISSAFDSEIVLTESGDESKNIVKILFNHHIKEIIRTGAVKETDIPRYDRYFNILQGILIYGFIRNLVNIGRNYLKFRDYDISGTILINKTLDVDDMFKCTFDELVDIDFTKHFNERTFNKIQIDFGVAEINKIYNEVMSDFNIDNLLCQVAENVDMNNVLLRELLFGINDGVDISYLYLCLYKILIIMTCSLMKFSVIDKSHSLFYSILNFRVLAQIFINPTDQFMVNGVNAKYNLLSALNGSTFFLRTINLFLIRRYNLQLKVYYKNKYIPNYNYHIYGYFADYSAYISKVGLRQLEQYISYIHNDIFHPDILPDSNKFTTYINPLTDFCIRDEKWGDEYDISDNTRLTFNPYSIVDISNTTINSMDYLNYNHYFMFVDSLYPMVFSLDYHPTRPSPNPPHGFYVDSDEDRIGFIKGNIRSLKQLMFNEGIFGNSNIVFLMSCAVDYNNNSTIEEVSLAEVISDDEQERKKYLKYKKKYLALKKKLNL